MNNKLFKEKKWKLLLVNYKFVTGLIVPNIFFNWWVIDFTNANFCEVNKTLEEFAITTSGNFNAEVR